ncbi:transcription initiation factor IIB [Elasticomyces elasticus]|nr:transcription initiation factor IIB [Elasticomyces elasticus]
MVTVVAMFGAGIATQMLRISDLIEENADTICASCGRVLAERIISNESEWRTFNSDEKPGDDPNRVGDQESDLLYGNSGTVIGGSGMGVSKETRKLQSAQRQQNEDKNNRALQTAYAQIESWAEADNFNSTVKAQAKGYYKKAYDAQAFRGKSINALLAACLFIACRQCKVGRSFNEVMNLTKVPKKEVGRAYKTLERFLTQSSQDQIAALQANNGTVNVESLEFKATTSSRPDELIPRFCSMLGLPYRVEYIAVKLALHVPSIPALAGRSPLSTAGACIYFASHLIGKGKSSSQISNVINVSDATVKHAYKFLLAEQARLIETDWLGEQRLGVKQGSEVARGDVANLPSS